MAKLTDCLNTHIPRVLDFSTGINPPADPVRWALEMFTRSTLEADMQFTEPAAEGDGEATISYFDQKDPESAARFKSALSSGQPVHGSLALIDYCAGDGTLRNNSDWAWHAFDKEFAKALEKHHPLGSYLRSTLWMSSGAHCYKAHCDLGDGFLVHMHGRKRVRVWPVPGEIQRAVIFNHADFEGRMASEPVDYELQPGQILFIPAGAMHEVVAQGHQPAVSLSYHMGSPFPLLTLCAQLNRIEPNANISLAPHLSAESKFELYFFQPTRFIGTGTRPGSNMPTELATELVAVLESDRVDPEGMNALLSQWWGIAMSPQQIYGGPYP